MKIKTHGKAMPSVRFQPANVVAEVPAGTLIHEAALLPASSTWSCRVEAKVPAGCVP